MPARCPFAGALRTARARALPATRCRSSRPSPYDPDVPEAFFVPDGDWYYATELSRGPWDPDAQHAGPPAALIARAVEHVPSDVPRLVGRLTYEILRPVPIGRVRVDAEIARPRRSG